MHLNAPIVGTKRFCLGLSRFLIKVIWCRFLIKFTQTFLVVFSLVQGASSLRVPMLFSHLVTNLTTSCWWRCNSCQGCCGGLEYNDCCKEFFLKPVDGRCPKMLSLKVDQFIFIRLQNHSSQTFLAWRNHLHLFWFHDCLFCLCSCQTQTWVFKAP